MDFQIQNYSPSGVDVVYYMYSSIEPQVRRANYSHLIKCYHDSLVESLDKFGYGGPKPTLQSITDTTERLFFFGLSFSIASIGFMKCQAEDAADTDKVIKSEGEEGFKFQALKDPQLAEVFGPDLIELVEKHLSF